MDSDAPVDEVDALATRIEEIDELGAGDDATYGNDQWGLGAVLKQLIKSADVEGVRKHLELIDYHDEAVSAHHLGLAARLPFSVQYGDATQATQSQRGREVLLLLVAAADEQTLGQCVVNTVHWTPTYSPGRRGPDFPSYDDTDPGGCIPTCVTVLHQFAWDGDVDAVAMFLALPQCTTRLVNATTLRDMNYDGSAPLDIQGGTRTLDDFATPTTGFPTPLHIACLAGRPSVVQMLLADGRADPNFLSPSGLSPLISTVTGAFAWDHHTNHLGRQIDAHLIDHQTKHRCAECCRALTRDPRTKVDIWYTRFGGVYDDTDIQCHLLHKLAKYALLEIIYHVLAALPNLDPYSVKMNDPHQEHGPIVSPLEVSMNGGTSTRFEHSRHATMVFLVEVSNAGGFKRWRAEKAREMMVTRALVARARSRGEFCATASLAHGLFNLRDDAIFLHVLGFCWLLNTRTLMPSDNDYEAAGLGSRVGTEERSVEEYRAADLLG